MDYKKGSGACHPSKKEKGTQNMKSQQTIKRGAVRTTAMGLTALAALVLGTAESGHGAQFTVTNTRDDGRGSLRWAIEAANTAPGADVITFAPGLQGTITLASQLSVTDDLAIYGSVARRLTLSGGGATRVFDISASGIEVMISNLTIADGLATDLTKGHSTSIALGGGIRNVGARVALSDVTLVNNQAIAPAPNTGAGGGGVANIFGATLTVTRGNFTGNRAISQSANSGDSIGGGIYNEVGSSLVVAESTFAANQAAGGTYLGSSGGAIFNATGSQATLSDSSFVDNLARGHDGSGATGGRGGAIANIRFGLLAPETPASLRVSGCTFTGNQAVGGDGSNGEFNGKAIGGAIVTSGGGSLTTVASSDFTGNLARGGAGGDNGLGGPAWSGALDVGSATLTVADSTFENNQAIGGDSGKGGNGSVGKSGGSAAGGAISSATLTFSPKVLPSLEVKRCTFIANGAVAGNGRAGGANSGGVSTGGGISVAVGTANVDCSRFIGNYAIGGSGASDGTVGGAGGLAAGGGVAVGNPYDPQSLGLITTCTFENNLAWGGAGGPGANGGDAWGGGAANGLGTLTISQSTLAGNQAIGGPGGAGARGGNAAGGGFWNIGSATLAKTVIALNEVSGGAPDGLAMGGGVFNAGLISIENPDLIFDNVPDDCFGCP